ncbi:hypothetical protein [Pararhodospirillum photometricum]|uniref:Hydrogenase maturation factor n=1 Tax=Pararhodospirillum photometricum DSM 122 TaxID=1150469 RepID=H6SN17_PARPM|nr:hypothetical protein [Pararhodospirillum photometricum]CCG06893.1 Hydrogenase maturation factor [Pararhodospirillum photometricum DSM 122]
MPLTVNPLPSPPTLPPLGPSVVSARLGLPLAVPDVLGLGAALKVVPCVMRGLQASLGPLAEDLGDPETLIRYRDTLVALLDEANVRPRLVAHDLHPDFPSTRLAFTLDLPTLAVQHHHAHVASVAVENGHAQPLLGLALDGFGLGPERAAWGGELLSVDGPAFTRLGGLAPLAQPGGDIAARQPWRMAAAVLHRLGRGAEIASRWDYPAAAQIGTLLDKGIGAPLTSSAGRLFDAAAALLGLHPVATFEGQAPMALEALVTRPSVMDGGWGVHPDGTLDLMAVMNALADERDAARGADLFHGTLAAALADWAVWASDRTGLRTVGLSGGCFLNRALSSTLVQRLRRAGLTVLTHRQVSPGDGGLALGAGVGRGAELDAGVTRGCRSFW